ncbi:helix-turn-helix domain-containing protein [Nocardiopsis sp. FR4]|uniref:helix-turn-helix domain-containing protein n=1 Tax=Nocardiopsis sp. FR4 TaxID=2605985 RepID=UPI001357514B|nr:helix-turn-helix domain-containing protein [Nocardiopsis sp. FR4]
MDPGQANYNPARLAAKLEALLRELPALTAPLPRHEQPTKKPGTAKRLKPQEVDELIVAYQAGTNVYKLGERFGINRQTVSAILKRHGVQIRKRGLTEEEIDEAVQLYQQGWSLTRIGKRFGVDSRTVRSRLLERGVRISKMKKPA